MILGPSPDPAITVSAQGPLLLPVPPEAWLHHLLGRDTQITAGPERLETVDGWKCELVRAQTPRGARLVARYQLFYHWAAVFVDVPTEDLLRTHHDALIRLLQQVRPDFEDDQIAVLDELWTER